MSTSASEYREQMEVPMEFLATELADLLPDGLLDYQIVERATEITSKLRELLVLTGRYSAEELKVILS